ncbi:hypothetical protein CAPTEDRAFT_203464 [Capitella teleta]|uniref:Uncharacterized protein n=1 Tax=Capitella teleta TaxID=283909 RepID=R7V6B7_CAPTE|nr:hypothetical protein CAPTEDRAFT_203464 [Capitella teleta]|eukprot:ELU14114.1 hypothetical protein CAPTEDRAFT_203464 [Capitella teleta]
MRALSCIAVLCCTLHVEGNGDKISEKPPGSNTNLGKIECLEECCQDANCENIYINQNGECMASNNSDSMLFTKYCQSFNSGSCVSSCTDIPAGDYQSCHGCGVHVKCGDGGIIYDDMPCVGGLVWDDVKKSCDWTSATCPSESTCSTYAMKWNQSVNQEDTALWPTEFGCRRSTTARADVPTEMSTDKPKISAGIENQPTTLSTTEKPPQMSTDQQQTSVEIGNQPTTSSTTEVPPEMSTDKPQTSAEIGNQPTTSSTTEVPPEIGTDKSQISFGIGDQPNTDKSKNKPEYLAESVHFFNMLQTERALPLTTTMITPAEEPVASEKAMILSWEAWTQWTVCHPSRNGQYYFSNGSFHRVRIRLCSLIRQGETHNTTCNRILKGENMSNQRVALAYDVHSEVCIPDVDGQLGDWTIWSKCSASCGQGTKFRARQCIGQTGKGRLCADSKTLQHEMCHNKDCPSEDIRSAYAIARRRGELLPPEVFTESDSEPSSIAISSVAIFVLCVVFGCVILFDIMTCVIELPKKETVKIVESRTP